MPKRSILLSSYRVPTHHPMMLGRYDAACWWNAWRVLWHPDLLRDAEHLPSVADAYEHATPIPDSIYVAPDSPEPHLPEDWQAALIEHGSRFARVGAEWPGVLAAVGGALGCELPDDDTARRCFALGLGYTVVDALFEAMDHQKLLDEPAFLAEMRRAATGDADAARAAAERLLATRDVVYPASIHLIDLALAGTGSLPRTGQPLAVIGSAADLDHLTDADREWLRDALAVRNAELAGGLDCERPDRLLPVESQLWSYRRGRARTRDRFGEGPTFFCRTTPGHHPYLPNWLPLADLHKVLLIPFEGLALPHRPAASIRWPAPDGRTISAITRAPQPADDAQTGFHLAHALHQTIMNDTAAVLLWLHADKPAAPWHDDLHALTRLAPVLGNWTTPGRYLDEGAIGDYANANSMDDFVDESLESWGEKPDPISTVARHVRLRRRLDAAESYLGLRRSLGHAELAELLSGLEQAEDALERQLGVEPAGLTALESGSAELLARRLLPRTGGRPGWLVLNASPMTRRVGLEGPDLPTPAVEGPIKAAQRDAGMTRLVVEIPGFGFSWIPDGSTPPTPPRMTLAQERVVRNEFFEAEIDPATGSLLALRDGPNRASRVGQSLVHQTGSTMRATDIRVTACGAALGEITATGQLLDGHGQELARFTQRYRAWLGRPLLEVLIELIPTRSPSATPWHDYFAARFTPGDEKAVLARGVFGRSEVTTQQRPGSPEFIEWRSGKRSTLLLTGGLPYAQRHGPHDLDLLLITPGESATTFQFALGLDRNQPGQSAQGFVSPVAVVRAEHGPPAVGPTGWLAHLDSSAVMVHALRARTHGVVMRLMEVTGVGGPVGLRWARDPSEAAVVDGEEVTQMGCSIDGDCVTFDAIAHDLINLKIDWD